MRPATLGSPPAQSALASDARRNRIPFTTSGAHELRVEVTPPSPYRLPLVGGVDGVLRRRGNVLERLLHHREEPVVVRVAQTSPHTVLFGARARTEVAARYGIDRMRFALGVDDDLSAFYDRFAHDPRIGRSVRSRPWLRMRRRPEPFEALAWAICEQLIEFERAAAIQRRIVGMFGPRGANWDGEIEPSLRDVPSPATLAGAAPARLESLDLSETRARLLVCVSREVASGRVDLHDSNHERGWERLRAIPGIGSWTVEMLALCGQGRHDQLPAGDLGLLKHVGRRLSGGDPRTLGTEEDVRSYFAPYGCWAGLAAVHLGVI
ncbi:MAG: DNA-3-methyladenine glycosylase family protein [Solirubrobacteraceae bacterium]